MRTNLSIPVRSALAVALFGALAGGCAPSLALAGEVVRVGAGKDLRYARPGTPIASRMLLLGLVPTA